jgi:adenosylcobyric acid synthase
MKGIMVQGTASDVGKSLITTAICRLLANEGIKTAPFKSQNMSNNSYVTNDGKEIGRAQGIQAEAAKTDASVWMNPILLKPRSAMQSEVVLFGKPIDTFNGIEYRTSFYEKGLEAINFSLQELNKDYEVIIMEGAGSPVEINLKDRELVNMKVAELADIPVVLVADIERGGVFASLIGTLELFTENERKRVKGILINKFRGDLALFEDGIQWIEERTGIPVLGVLPYLDQHMIDGEDSLSLSSRLSVKKKNGLDIVIFNLPFISNYSDMEPFMYEEDVTIRLVQHASEFGHPDAVIIPGTKSTIADLQFLKKQGLDILLQRYVEDGGRLIGICGGFQMLGDRLIDEFGSDTGNPNHVEAGLGLIAAETAFHPEKVTVQTSGTIHPNSGFRNQEITGYEIHLGRTTFTQPRPFLLLDNGEVDGYIGENGRLIGTYIHHLFHNDEWRNDWLNGLRRQKGLNEHSVVNVGLVKDERYNELANGMLPHLDWKRLKEIIFTGA